MPKKYEFIKKSNRVDGVPARWRLPPSCIKAIDAIVASHNKANLRHPTSRSAVIRDLIAPNVAQCCEDAVIAIVAGNARAGIESLPDEKWQYYSLWIPATTQSTLQKISDHTGEKIYIVAAGVISYQLQKQNT
jgi:hypothetical protein